jgi:hypothetical protein
MKERVTPRERHTEQRKRRENRDSLSEKKIYMPNGTAATAVVIIVIIVVPF